MAKIFNGVNEIKTHKTHFDGILYANTNPVGKAVWRFIDAHDEGRLAAVGPVYPSKETLLADLPNYAKTWGYDA